MSKQLINIGSSPNDGTGDNLRESFIKINSNFNDVYSFTGYTGTSGTSGINGTNGTSGINGTTGTSGTSGLNGSSGGASVTNVTYSELLDLINTLSLTIGTQYLITDYSTVHIIPYTSDLNSGITEPLLVTAIGLDKLKPEAHSYLYSQDVIYYNFNNNQTVVPGCTTGYIYRRIDTIQNNDFPFDFRNVKFRRWQINVTNIWNSGTTYNSKDVVLFSETNQIYICIKNNTTNINPNNNDDSNGIWQLFEYYNLSYISCTEYNLIFGDITMPCSTGYTDSYMWSDFDYYYSTSYSNIINISELNSNIINGSNNVILGVNFRDNNINVNFYNNTIGNDFNNNTIGRNFIGNSISDNFKNNLIDDNFKNNSIGDTFQANSIGYEFKYNSIGSAGSYNKIGRICNNNIISTEFTGNNIGDRFYNNMICKSFSSNTLGDDCYNNVIDSNFNANVIGNNFNINIINTEFTRNSIGNTFQINSIGIQFLYNNIGDFFTNNIIADHFTSNSINSSFSSNNISNLFTSNNIGSTFDSNIVGIGFTNNSIGNSFRINTISDYFQMNSVCDNFGGLDFTLASYVYLPYTKELYVDDTNTKKLQYNRMIIVDANA